MPRVCALLSLLVCTASALPIADTIGWTDRDRQMHGPALRYLVNDTLSGVHAVWKTGYGEIRYNFRPHRGNWRWPQGTVVCPEPRNLGCVDVNIRTGCAVISCDRLTRGQAVMTQFIDSAPGAARFYEELIAPGSRNPLVGTANYGFTKHLAVRNDTVFFRIMLSAFRLGYVGPFPSYNLGVSKQTGRYGCIWSPSDGPQKNRLFFRQTPNNGQNWYPIVALSDSLLHPLNSTPQAATAVYDSIRGHLVFAGFDGSEPAQAAIWHYCSYLQPQFSLVHCYSVPIGTRLGTTNLVCGRPSIGANRRIQEYYVVWEQFDPFNVDEQTGLCRADIWASRSADSGRTWGPPTRLTRPDSTSKRYPFLAEVVNDTLHIIYFADRAAGLWEHDEGPTTTNPVVYLRVPVTDLPLAITEASGSRQPDRQRPRATIVGPYIGTDRRYDCLGRIRSNGTHYPTGIYFLGPAQRIICVR